MQSFTWGKFRVHNFLDATKKIKGLLLLNLPCLQCTGKCRQLLTHAFLFHHHSVQLALKSANEQFRLRIFGTMPSDRITVFAVSRLRRSMSEVAAHTGRIRIHGFSANAKSTEAEEARELSTAHKTTCDPGPAARRKDTGMINTSWKDLAKAHFFSNAFQQVSSRKMANW